MHNNEPRRREMVLLICENFKYCNAPLHHRRPGKNFNLRCKDKPESIDLCLN